MKLLAAAILLAMHLPAQGEKQSQVPEWLAMLQSADPVEVELGRRQLCLLKEPPREALEALLQNPRPDVVAAATSILHPAGKPVSQPIALVRQQAMESSVELRWQAVYLMHQEGVLDDDTLLSALTSEDESLQDLACRIMVFFRSPFPLSVAEKVLQQPEPRSRLLDYLVDRPRQATAPWLQRLLQENLLSKEERVLAMAALPGSWIDKAMAVELLGLLAEGCDVYRIHGAAQRFAPEVADALVVEAVTSPVPASIWLPMLQRISPKGRQALLQKVINNRGAGFALEALRFLHRQDAELLSEHVQQALDGEDRVTQCWLPFTSPYLDTPKRIARVAAYLGSGDPLTAGNAFSALLAGKVYSPQLVDYVLSQESDLRRLRRLLKLPKGVLPVAAYKQLLAARSVQFSAQCCATLAWQGVPQGLEADLLELGKSPLPSLRIAAQHAMLVGGSALLAHQVWTDLSRAEKESYGLGALLKRRTPWLAEALLKELQGIDQAAPDHPRVYRLQLLQGLLRLEISTARKTLLKELPNLTPAVIREAGKAMAGQLDQEDYEALLPLLAHAKALSLAQRIEILPCLLPQKEQRLQKILLRIWQEATEEEAELRLAALQGLLTGAEAEEFHGHLRELLAVAPKPGQVGDAGQEEVWFEVVGSMSPPLSDSALDLVARILVLQPLQRPQHEVALSMADGWNSTRRNYLLLRPMANLLRRHESLHAGEIFTEVAAEVGDGRAFLNRRRLGLFLCALAHRHDLLSDLGPGLARLLLSAPDQSQVFVGPSKLMLAQEAEAQGRFAEAAKLYGEAAGCLLLQPLPLFVVRAFLEEPEPSLQEHAPAALASRQHICHAQALAATGKLDLAAKAWQRGQDLAEADMATLIEIKTKRENGK